MTKMAGQLGENLNQDFCDHNERAQKWRYGFGGELFDVLDVFNDGNNETILVDT